MKYQCETVKDLLPLYHDGVCSDSSKQIVEEHLSECDSCNIFLKRMEDNTYDDRLQKEREHVVEHYVKNVKRKSLTVGLCIAAILAIPIFICLIVNIATGQALDWFFIVLTSLMLLASLTVIPLVVEERKGLWTLGSFTASLMLLLLTCSIYVGGNWFFVASIAIVFGLSVVFLPFVIRQLPLKGFISQNRGLIVMAVDTILFYSLIVVCGLYSNSAAYWNSTLLISSACILFPWILFAIIRYSNTNTLIKSGLCAIVSGFFVSMIHDVIYWILEGVLHISIMDANLMAWNTNTLINANTYLLILLLGCFLGAVLIIVGLICGFNSKTKKKSNR